MPAFSGELQVQDLSEHSCCHVVWMFLTSKRECVHLPFPLTIKYQLLLISQWCELFLLVCTWNSGCCLVRGQHADFSTAAHWEAHPKMTTEVSYILIFLRFQTARDLDTNFQLCCSEGKGEAGCVPLEMHWMTRIVCALIVFPMLKWAAWWVDTADLDHPLVLLYHIWFQKCCKVWTSLESVGICVGFVLCRSCSWSVQVYESGKFSGRINKNFIAEVTSSEKTFSMVLLYNSVFLTKPAIFNWYFSPWISLKPRKMVTHIQLKERNYG